MGVFNVIRRLIRFGSIFCLIFLFPSPLTAGLDNFQYRVIKIAFMNGYVRALGTDLETIKSLLAESEHSVMPVHERRLMRLFRQLV